MYAQATQLQLSLPHLAHGEMLSTELLDLGQVRLPPQSSPHLAACLLYTSDAADEEDSVDLGGRRII